MSKSKLIGIIAACIAVIIAIAVIATPGKPPTPLAPGPEHGDEQQPTSPEGTATAWLVFERPGGIHTMRIDGSSEQRLTEGREPLWAPGGDKILFHNPGEGWGIIRADGSDRVMIPPPEQSEDLFWYKSYRWSPTGEKVVFAVRVMTTASDYNGIYLADADGGDFTQILRHEYGVIVAAFSPDGNRIAYLAAKGSSKDRLSNTYNLYLVNSDGTNNSKLAEDDLSINWGNFNVLAWSPDAKKILYGDNNSLYVIDTDGTNKLTLGGRPDAEAAPQWAPDGKLIAYSRNERIYIVRPDATGFREICSGYYVLRWSPDGQRIEFSRQDGLYTVDIDGSNINKLFPFAYGDIYWGSP